MASYYPNEHLNKPLPPPLSTSPAPIDASQRSDTMPSRQDTLASSHYSQRGNTLPMSSQFPPARNDTYTSSVYTQPTAYYGDASAHPPLPQASIYSNPPDYVGQQHLGSSPQSQNISTSPYETDLDDHYASKPLPSSRQYSNDAHAPLGYPGSSSQHSPSEDALHENAIPLQDRNAKDQGADVDHVYEAPRRKASKKQGVRFGELGMLGSYGNKIPWVVYIFTAAQIGVFIGEIIQNATQTGSPIEIHPNFNYLIGPSPYVMINFGARFVPCMHNVEDITDATSVISWPCPNTTSSDTSTYTCTLSDLCGFGGIPEPKYDSSASMSNSPEPNQWWRFIIPMFMHAGLIHIGFNLLLQLTMGKEMEKSIGSLRFFLVYVSAGIFGFVLGGNYANVGSPSTGASGALFGVIGLTLLDLFYSWSDRLSPKKDLAFIMLDIVISLVLGLLPGVDNFSHIGGLIIGIALGISVLHSPNALRRRIGEDAPYSAVNAAMERDTPPGFLKNPVGFFKGRKPLWWAWWLIRAAALLAVFIGFIVLLNNFYVYHVTCSWCKYLSCLPVNNWCDTGSLTVTTTTSSSKRDLLSAADFVATAARQIPREFFG